MKTIILLQARMNSTRLPGKILMDLNGKSILERVIERLQTFSKYDDLIVVTTDSLKDDATCALLEKIGVKYFRGSESNVLERYYLCALENGATQVIRATADDPLTDISLLEYMFDQHITKGSDYTYTSGYPVGVQEEIVTFGALRKCYENSTKENHFEHVLEYILENNKDFIIDNIIAPEALNREDVRVTVDTKEDFEIVKKYFFDKEYTLSLDTKKIIDKWNVFNA